MRRDRFGGLRFQKRINVLPGLRINLSLSGIGWSAGVRGFRVGRSGDGRRFVSAGIPGTGLSMRQYVRPASCPPGAQRPALSRRLWIALVVLAVLLAVVVAASK
jgi:hypothetical protein